MDDERDGEREGERDGELRDRWDDEGAGGRGGGAVVGGRGSRPGPVYDRELKWLTKTGPSVVMGALGIGVGDRPEPLDATFVRASLEPDVLLRVGPGRIVQVEFQGVVEADLVPRLLTYRGLIMQEYPGETLEQYVVVLRRGRVRGFDDLEGRGFALRVGVIDLRTVPAERFLVDPLVAPFAAIAFEGAGRRGEALVQALRLIGSAGGRDRGMLTESALVLATLRLDGPTIMRAAKESGMIADSVAEHFRGTELEQIFLQRGEARGIKRGIQQGREQGLEQGLERGIEQGREQGIEQGRAKVLVALLEQRFGPCAEAEVVAGRLARMSESRALELVMSHDSFEAVLAASADAD